MQRAAGLSLAAWGGTETGVGMQRGTVVAAGGVQLLVQDSWLDATLHVMYKRLDSRPDQMCIKHA